MADNYATAVLYKADIEHELYNRANGVDAEDYILVDSLCAELSRCLGVDYRSFQDLRYKTIKMMPVSRLLASIYLGSQI